MWDKICYVTDKSDIPDNYYNQFYRPSYLEKNYKTNIMVRLRPFTSPFSRIASQTPELNLITAAT